MSEPKSLFESRERAERDAGIIIDNYHSQLSVLSARLAAKETALQRIMDAVTLQEAVRIARGGNPRCLTAEPQTPLFIAAISSLTPVV
jgi:hypothetical protein